MSTERVPHNPIDAAHEVEILKDVIRSLLPDRHAIGRLCGEFSKTPTGATFNVTVTVPLDRSDDESQSREIAAALMPEILKFQEMYSEALRRAAERVAAESALVDAALAGLRAEHTVLTGWLTSSDDFRDRDDSTRDEFRIEAIESVIKVLERAKAEAKR